MSRSQIESVANAVLYEGYLLYPYRASAVKNRQRWNFGVVYPRAYSELQTGNDAWRMQTECLLTATPQAALAIKVRFLQSVFRQVGKLQAPAASAAEACAADYEPQESLRAGDQMLQTWQEAVEREISLPALPLAGLLAAPAEEMFGFPAGRAIEPVSDGSGAFVAVLVRSHEELQGKVEVRLAECGAGAFRLTVAISNLTGLSDTQSASREEALRGSFLSAHTILGIAGGNFISMIDPPQEMRQAAANCENIGTWPVLAGAEGSADAILSSPIILYDYPQIAPESPGDLFDGTEIDEILALRILTLTDEEKNEIRQTDQRAKEVLARTEALPPEHFLKLHGALRGIKPPAEAEGEKP